MKEKLLELMEQSYQEIQDLVDDLNEDEQAAATSPEKWGAKDHLGHIAEWTRILSDRLSGIQHPFISDGTEELEQENARIYEKYRAQSWEDVLSAVRRVFQEMNDHIQNLSEDELIVTDRLPQQGNRPLWHTIVGNIYIHPILHLGYVYLARGDRESLLRLNEESAQSLLELDVSPSWQGTTLYNLACSYALAGEKTKAISFLSQALRFEPGLIEWSKQDSDLLSLHGDPEYQAIYDQQQQ